MSIREVHTRDISAAAPPSQSREDYWPDGPKIAKSVAATLPFHDHYPWESIDCVIHITQALDNTALDTSCVVYETLGLPATRTAFDAVRNCGSYCYGLWRTSRSFFARGAKRALFLVGDITWAHIDDISPTGKVATPLYGDTGSATILNADPSVAPMGYLNGTEGTGWLYWLMPGSGRRNFNASTKLDMHGVEGVRPHAVENPSAYRRIRRAGEPVGDGEAAAIFSFVEMP